MIEQPSDPRRGQRGRHHDRHRRPGGDKRREQAIETVLVVLETDGSTARVAGHLARALSATLVLWDRRSGDSATAPDCAFADVDLVHFDALGETADVLYRKAMVSDLVIVSAGSSALDLSAATGRAVLVVPGATIIMPGARVAVRWDGTRQTAAALREARPLLRDAECIWIVDVEGRARRGFKPNDAACYLERHGFDAYQIEAEGCCLADLIAHQDIDLVVGAEAPTFWSLRSPEHFADTLRIPLLVSA